MNRMLSYLALVVVFGFCGCFSSTPKRSSSVFLPEFNATGKVIKPNEFKKGGSLVILPFKAGENAAAGQQLDRVSLMIVKGMIDYLAQEKTPFTVLTTEEQGKPDLIIDGYINNFTEPGRMKRWVMQNKNAVLAVDGYMEIPATKERILIFQHQRSIVDRKKDGLSLAYAMGQDLGRFIVESLQQ
jgi:hypothetical protein